MESPETNSITAPEDFYERVGAHGSQTGSSKWVFVWLFALATTLFAILLSAPPRLGQNNEDRMAEYVTDAVQNGNWICQKDAAGNVMSKPPMASWIASVATLLTGGVTRFSLYFPSALAALGLSWILYVVGRNEFSERAGFLCGTIYLLSNVAVNEMATARFDALFAFFVALGAISAFRAWRTGKGWTWFWLAAAGATLTKGPLGLVLSAIGLLAVFFQKKDAKVPLRGSHLPGITLFLLITGGWFALAYWKLGSALINKMILDELVGHVANEGKDGGGFYKPTLWFLSDFGPWSLFFALALWRVVRKPTQNPRTRSFEQFLSCWFVVGLLLFSFSGHERSRLIFPLVPAAALLAGAELERLTRRFSRRTLVWSSIFCAVIMLSSVGFYYHVKRAQTRSVRENVELRNFAHSLQNRFGKTVSITHIDTPFPLRFYLKDFGPFTTLNVATKLLESKTPALIAVSDSAELKQNLDSTSTAYRIVARWPETGKPKVEILSNDLSGK